MIRDEEIERLVKFAQGMGIKVTFSKAKKATDAADWYLDGSQITVYKHTNNTKLQVILSLIHEISHHLYFVHSKDRKLDTNFEKAIDAEEKHEKEKSKKPVPEKHRYSILSFERDSTLYWKEVYKSTNLKFPIWKLYANMEFDIYQYEYYAQSGKFPTVNEKRLKMKEINAKHKNIKYE